MERWLSFIVPIYNAENYLRQCVDSLLDQDFPKELYEIILYNDGSTDNSLNIAKEYAANFNNVHVFTHPNSGVSNTRNAGIKESVGEYIWFIDNDDCIVKDILPTLYGWTLKEDVEMLIFDSIRFQGDRYWKLTDFTIKETPVITGVEAFMNFYYEPVPWNKLFKRAFVEKYHLYFLQRLSEDSELASRCFYHATRVKVIPVDAIYYRVLPSSFSHTESNRKALVGGLLECLDNHYKYMLEHPGNRFWMRSFVLDLRRLHNVGLDRVVCTAKERRAFINREQDILKNVISNLPLAFELDYFILRLCAISPILIMKIQTVLRKMKYLKSKIIS